MNNSKKSKLQLGAIALLLGSALGAAAQVSAPAPGKTQVVALVAAVGDKIDIVRQRPQVASNREPFTRRAMPVNGQTLNMAVLKGLNRAIEEEEPTTQRVLLRWTAPADLAEKLAKAAGEDRESLVLDALKTHLRSLPQRAGWDRIEAIVPSYFYSGVGGMGRKLSGMGFYVQPNQKMTVTFSEEGEISDGPGQSESVGEDQKTIDPNTGNVSRSDTFIAPYMYFKRITLDARTLEVVGTKRQFDNVKYADPNSTAVDVGESMSLAQMTAKLLEVAERSAYKSVRGNKGDVTVTAPRELPASAPR